MRILVAASEAVPFCKSGGLADVVGTLARIFSQRGHEVVLFLPKYQAIDRTPLPACRLAGSFLVLIGDHAEPAHLFETRLDGVRVLLVDCPKYYDRPGLYGTPDGDYPDNDERFIFFSRAVVEGAKFIDFQPDILHCHDWQAALLPAYLKTLHRADGFYARAGTLLTVHNFAYQGSFSRDSLFLAGFGWADFTPDRLEYYGGFNLLKAGLVFADLINTVSPTYARQTQDSSEYGRGLEGVLRHRAADYVGILNGIDTDYWNPQTDTFLHRRYGPRGLAAGKRANKEFLRKSLGLDGDPDVPLAGVVSRLDPQKGLDLVLAILPPLLAARKVQLVLLGNGQRELAEAFARLAQEHPGAVHVGPGFDEGLAHRIYAGADLLLVPSRFEPCGLTQMIAMRYGTIPVVTRTGGLADSVIDAGSDPEKGNGFVADSPTPDAVRGALQGALAAFRNRARWQRFLANAVAADFSWMRPVEAYLEIFQRILVKVRGTER